MHLKLSNLLVIFLVFCSKVLYKFTAQTFDSLNKLFVFKKVLSMRISNRTGQKAGEQSNPLKHFKFYQF